MAREAHSHSSVTTWWCSLCGGSDGGGSGSSNAGRAKVWFVAMESLADHSDHHSKQVESLIPILSSAAASTNSVDLCFSICEPEESFDSWKKNHGGRKKRRIFWLNEKKKGKTTFLAFFLSLHHLAFGSWPFEAMNEDQDKPQDLSIKSTGSTRTAKKIKPIPPPLDLNACNLEEPSDLRTPKSPGDLPRECLPLRKRYSLEAFWKKGHLLQ